GTDKNRRQPVIMKRTRPRMIARQQARIAVNSATCRGAASPRVVSAFRGAVLICLLGAAAAASAREVEVALHAPPSPRDARERALEWVAATNPADKSLLQKVGALWAFGDEVPGTHELFERTIETFAAVDPATA